MVEQAFHFWRTIFDWEDVLDQHNFKHQGDFSTTYLWWTNVTKQITHVPPEELIFVSKREVNGWNRAVSTKKDSVARMKHILRKFRKPESFSRWPFCQELCYRESRHHAAEASSLISCEIDMECCNQSYISVVDLFARHILNEHSYINGWKEFAEAAKVFIKTMSGIAPRTWKMIWKATLDLSQRSRFQAVSPIRSLAASRTLVFSTWGREYRYAAGQKSGMQGSIVKIRTRCWLLTVWRNRVLITKSKVTTNSSVLVLSLPSRLIEVPQYSIITGCWYVGTYIDFITGWRCTVSILWLCCRIHSGSGRISWMW